MSEGSRLGDRYEVGELLGRGGMAEVHVGRDLRLGRRVAIKILRADLARDPSFLARFRREAQSAASLNHPNIVAVYDTGEDTLGEGRTATVVPFIVMELVDGRTLKELLQSGNPLVPERSLEITSGILSALDYSHRHGIIHRDIKPGNVMMTAAGTVKVMDFGIARATADTGVTGTSTHTVLGTAAYLSPEQAQGRPVDARSDLYSTGVVLFELLTRRPPFVGEAPVAVAFAHVNEPPAAPSSVDPNVPKALDAIVLKALAKDPADRFQSAVEFRSDVDRAIAGVPVTQVMPGIDGDATAMLGPTGTDATAVLGGAAAVGTAGAVAAGATGPMTPVIPGGAGSPYAGPPQPEPEQSKKGGGIARALGIVALVAVIVGLAGWFGMSLLSDDTKTVEVPDVTGQSLTSATSLLQGAGLRVGREDYKTSDEPKDSVISQNPIALARIDEGSAVDLVISIGKEQATVPELVGINSPDDARKALEAAGLILGRVKPQDSDQPEGTVLSQSPEAYEQVDAGSSVDIVVSNAQVEVPNVVGKSDEQARRTLFDQGFEVNYADDLETDDAEPGTVMRQSPGAGGMAKKGSTVTLTLAKEPEETPTPSETPIPSPTDTGIDGGGVDGQGGDGLALDPGEQTVTTEPWVPGLSATPIP